MPYDESFFAYHEKASRQSAAEVVPWVLQFVQPASVVDVGCGTGLWLAEFARAGVADYLGLDGDYVDRSKLAIESGRFLARNLAQPLEIGRRFDLAVSLEVAEHLPSSSAEGFVHSLVRLAPVVLFSAAIPHQGGTDHVNEQWPEYWQEKFAAHDYVAVDPLRDRLWGNKNVAWYYAQNMLFFVDRSVVANYPPLARRFEMDGEKPRLSLVHPAHYESIYKELYEKAYRSQCLAMRMLLQLRTINFVVFPDWSQSEHDLLAQLRGLLKALANHPDRARLALVLHFGQFESKGGPLAQRVHQEILMPGGSPSPSMPSLAGIGASFGPEQWEVVLACVQGRIELPREDRQAIVTLKADQLPGTTLAMLERGQSFN